MKLNGVELSSYSTGFDDVSFVLVGVDLVGALSLATDALVITSNDKEYMRFEGYVSSSVAYQNDNVLLVCVRKIDESTQAAIHAIEENIKTVDARTNDAVTAANEASDKIVDVEKQLSSLTSAFEVMVIGN